MRCEGAGGDDGSRRDLLTARSSVEIIKGCDLGYALAAGSCKGVDNVDACTVTASDVTVAFATSGPNVLLAEFVGFFGSERPANYFAGAITQPTSDWQHLIDANPFDRRHKPDFGCAPAACSCERVDNPDARTASARYVITAFAVSGPGLSLAEPAGFFGSERPVNRFTGPITQPTSDQLLFISTVLSTVDASDPNRRM